MTCLLVYFFSCTSTQCVPSIMRCKWNSWSHDCVPAGCGGSQSSRCPISPSPWWGCVWGTLQPVHCHAPSHTGTRGTFVYCYIPVHLTHISITDWLLASWWRVQTSLITHGLVTFYCSPPCNKSIVQWGYTPKNISIILWSHKTCVKFHMNLKQSRMSEV